MSTTWTQEDNGVTGWTAQGGVSVSSIVVNNNFADNEVLAFGSDSDYGMLFDATDNRLEFVNPNNQTIASMGLTGLYLEQVNFIELDTLPTAEKGRMVMFNNAYYLGVD